MILIFVLIAIGAFGLTLWGKRDLYMRSYFLGFSFQCWAIVLMSIAIGTSGEAGSSAGNLSAWAGSFLFAIAPYFPDSLRRLPGCKIG
ncbi:hypothetical protein EON81_18685 [bacterium]|nr:MAG: hypothetical protein EON81_18685 [bacterium]